MIKYFKMGNYFKFINLENFIYIYYLQNILTLMVYNLQHLLNLSLNHVLIKSLLFNNYSLSKQYEEGFTQVLIKHLN